jgi:hypothetical protein
MPYPNGLNDYIMAYIIKLFSNVQVIKSPYKLHMDFHNLLETMALNIFSNH